MFDVGTAIVVAEAATEGISSSTLVDVVGSPVLQLIILSLAGLVGWTARGKSQRSVDALLELEESIQKLQPKSDEEISPIKQSQLGYVNVLMANELSRRLIAMPSLLDYVGVIAGFVAFFLAICLLVALNVFSSNIAVIFIFIFLACFVVIGLSIGYHRQDKKRDRAVLARKMVESQMNLGNTDSASGYANLLNVNEMIPIPAAPWGKSILERKENKRTSKKGKGCGTGKSQTQKNDGDG